MLWTEVHFYVAFCAGFRTPVYRLAKVCPRRCPRPKGRSEDGLSPDAAPELLRLNTPPPQLEREGLTGLS